MNKAQAMDEQIQSLQNALTSETIISTVKTVYRINLDKLPILDSHAAGAVFPPGTTSEEAIATRLTQEHEALTGSEIRRFINELFGVNLDAISALDGSGVSLFSKDQWIVQNEKDLFVVWTGKGDVDVKVYTTDYFAEKAGSSALPLGLEESLLSLEFVSDEETGGVYFRNPTGEAVADSFKGQTMGIILQTVRELN